jgi:hypothetical protein
MENCVTLCKRAVRFGLALSLPAIAFLCFGSAASAQSYDLFQTGSGASVDLSSMGLGVVPLQGVPIQTSMLGNTDTIMQRGTLSGEVYPVSMYALYMKSTSPVTYKGQSADVYITLNNSNGFFSQSVLPQPDSLSASTGTVTITSSSTFNSSITVNADVIIVIHGDPPTNSADILGHQAAPSITLTSTNSTYTTTPPPGYPSNPNFPANGFYPKPNHTGPHPVVPSSCNGGIQPTGMKGDAVVRACIANPE